MVIPAHPLALNAQRKLDERRQVALTRYYCDAGAGGIAVGVHTTQFAIRDPRVGLFEPVLRLAAGAAAEFERRAGKRIIKVAGVCGPTPQAVAEAEFARDAGYDIGLLSLAALPAASDAELLEHCRAVAREIPVCGFYLQPSVGGRLLSYEFWRGFCAIEGVAAIKVAPFNRYQTIDVVRGLIDSGRAGRDRALHRERRQHHSRPAWRSFGSAEARRFSAAGCSGNGRCGRAARSSCWRGFTAVARRTAPGRRRYSRNRRRSRTPTPRCSTCAIASPDASPACTRSCGGRVCSRAAGVSIRPRIFRPGNWKRSTVWLPRTPISPMTILCAATSTAG